MKKSFLFFVCAFLLISKTSFALSDDIYKELTVFSQIIQMVDKHYVEDVDEKKLIDGAIRGMLLSLDPHTVYLSKDVYNDFMSDVENHFGGVGMEVTIKDNYVTVISPLEGTPAYRAGIRAGDKIVKINDISTKGMSLLDAVNMIQGPVGKKVKLTVYHVARGQMREINVKRAQIESQPVRFEDLGDGYAYFRIKSFQEDTAKKLKQAILKFDDEREGKVNGLLLDLRGNPGGLLSEAAEMVDLFVKNGVIVSTKGRDKKQEYIRAKSRGTLKKYPLGILIDGGSASASEIVAGALQDYKRATLYGTQSFGKGSVQTVFALNKGDALKITIARYYTPKNRMIDKKGIEPDYIFDQDKFKKELEKEISEDESKRPKFTFAAYLEYQKQQALEHLKRGK